MKFFLGLDGGGSVTNAVVVNDMFQILGRGQSGASNHYAVGTEVAAQHCREAAQHALLEASRVEPTLQTNELSSWGFGLAGVRRETDAALMRDALQKVVQGKPFVLDHDAAAAQSGAFAGAAGIVLSAGTGAICFGVDDVGERFFADGWGPILGDEGSGFWIGQEAMKAVCRAHDGRGQKTSLADAVFSTLDVRDPDELVQRVYRSGLARDEIAKLARAVFDAANAGSTVAGKIKERATRHLCNSAIAVVRAMLSKHRERADLKAVEPREIALVLRGGLFDDDDFRGTVGYNIGESLVEMKRDYWPISGWKIVRPQYEAAAGAALLAQKKFG